MRSLSTDSDTSPRVFLILVAVVAVLSVLSLALGVAATIISSKEASNRQAQSEQNRLANVENLCTLLTDVINAQQRTTVVLVGILRRSQADVEQRRQTYRALGVDPNEIILRAERDASRLESARPSNLTCEDGRIRSQPPAPIPKDDG